MPKTEPSTAAKGVFVSLQAPDHGDDLVGGHRATGVLVDEDLVIVPHLPQSTITDLGQSVVVLVPLPVPTAGPAEVAKVAQVEVHAVKGTTKKSVFGVVRLASPTSLPVATSASPTSMKRALDVANGSGGMWPALVEGKDGVRIFRPSPSRVLSQVVELTALGERPAVKVVSYRNPGDFSLSWCAFVPWCEPGGGILRPPRDVDVHWM
jgi:hypothetical protein